MERMLQPNEQILMHDMGLTDAEIERRKRYVGLAPDDLKRIAIVREVVLSQVEPLTDMFFNFLSTLDEARGVTGNRETLQHARQLEREHLAAMVQGDYGQPYVEQRLRTGLLYSKAGLENRVFLGAFHHMLRSVGGAIMRANPNAPTEAFDNFMALKKIAFFDLGVVVDVLVYERQRLIQQQAEAIRELSTPVLQIRDRLLLLPIIGVIDTHRARLITESVLRAVRDSRAKVVVMDVTGVATIDSRVANHLLQTVTAAKLMGALVIVTGVSSDVAQSLVALGIELATVNTVGDLQGGVEEAERLLGYRVVKAEG